MANGCCCRLIIMCRCCSFICIHGANNTPDERGLVYADPWLSSAAVRAVCRSFDLLLLHLVLFLQEVSVVAIALSRRNDSFINPNVHTCRVHCSTSTPDPADLKPRRVEATSCLTMKDPTAKVRFSMLGNNQAPETSTGLKLVPLI